MQETELIVSGVANGCIYALVALSFVIVYNAVGAINFAQGDFVMLGGYAGVWAAIILGLPLWVALVVALGLMGVFGLVFQRVVYVPIQSKPTVTFLVASLAAGIALRNAVLLTFGPQPHSLAPLLGTGFVGLPGVNLPADRVAVILVTAIILAAQYLLFTRTTVGKMLRATAQDPTAARLMGIRVRHMIVLTFVISAVVSGATGFVLAPIVFVYPDVGTPLVVNAFIAAVIGGFGSIQGAVVGGILVGVAQVLLAAYVSSQWTDLFLFVALIGFLAFYPRGIFGETVSEKT